MRLPRAMCLGPALLAAAASAQPFHATRICCSQQGTVFPSTLPPAMGEGFVAFPADDATLTPQGLRTILRSDISVREDFLIIAQQGQPLPQDPTKSMWAFDSPLIRGDHVAFSATTVDPGFGPYAGLYVSDGASATTWLDTVQPPATTTLLPLSFDGSILVQKNCDALLVHGPGDFTTLLSCGDSIPGGTISGFYAAFAVAEEIAVFRVGVEHAPEVYDDAILVKNIASGATALVVDWTDELPGLGTYDGLSWTETDGELVYFVAFRNGTAVEPPIFGLYSVPVTGGEPTPIAISGDFAPGGGVFSEFAPHSPLQHDQGQLVFEARDGLGGGILPSQAIFLRDADGMRRVVGTGDFLEGGTVSSVYMGPQGLNNGRVAVALVISNGQPFGGTLYHYVFDVWPCPADLTGSTDPNSADYGVRDGLIDTSDFFYYLDLFVADNGLADMTSTSDPFDPLYGVPDGFIDGSDFFYYIDLFVQGCAE